MKKRNIVARAGFIPYHIENGELSVLMMKPSDPKYGGPDFQIAKGHVDFGEDAKTAGLREAEEELGLRMCNVVAVLHLGNYLGNTEIYYGEVRDREDFGAPSYETGETRWMTFDQFFKTGRGIHKGVLNDLQSVLQV